MPDGTNGAPASQAPAGAPATGQAPQANNSGSPSAASQPQAGGDNSGSQQQAQLSQADYDRIIADLRRENAGHRTENQRIAADLKKLQDAQLTDQQKRERDFAEMQTKTLEQELTLQRLHLENAGMRLAPSLGIADPSAAIALVQAEHAGDIQREADGTIKNLDALLKKVLADHPVLAGAAQAQPRPPASSGGATNPGRAAGNGGLTLEQIKSMPMRERMARWEEIEAWKKAQQ